MNPQMCDSETPEPNEHFCDTTARLIIIHGNFRREKSLACKLIKEMWRLSRRLDAWWHTTA